jgi:hypothetical protein
VGGFTDCWELQLGPAGMLLTVYPPKSDGSLTVLGTRPRVAPLVCACPR